MNQLKSHRKLPSKDKESDPSSQDVAKSWVSTEVDFTATIGDKPTKENLKLMYNAQKRRYKKREGNRMKMQMKYERG